MAFTFDPIFAVDPNNPATVAKNASITIFDPADPNQAPIAIQDPTGVPLPNPMTVDASGMGPAYQHPTLARVGWKGAGFVGYFTSYEGMFNETVAAKDAAQSAVGEAAAAAADRVTAATVTGGKLILTKATGATVDAGSVIGPRGEKGDKGSDGANVLPTDTAIKQAITTPGTETQAALSATYALKGATGGLPPVYYLDLYKDFVTGPWVTGQVNTPTTLTAQAASGTNTISVASGATYPTGAILSVFGGTANQQQYKITAGGGTNTLTVTPNIVTTIPNGTAINTLWGDASHLNDSAALAYFITNSKRKDGTDVIQNPGGKPIVLLGNSWFVGSGSAIAASLTAKYPGANVINKGVNGNTSNQVLARFDTDVPSDAAYVLIDEPGVNDSAHGALTYRENSIRNLVALVEKCRAIGAIPVFIGPPPLALYPNASLEMSIYLRELLSSPNFPNVSATAVPKFQAPSGVPEADSLSLGANTLDRTTTAIQNIAIGKGSQLVNATSNGNVSVGVNTMPGLTSGNGANVAVGTVAMYAVTTASRSVAVGQGALYSPNGVGANATLAAANNVAIGYNTGATDNTDPGGITVVGATSRANLSGVAIGNAAVAGKNAVAVGAGTSATGEGSVAIGRDWTAVSASTTVNNEIKLGTALHTTKIVGRLNVAPRTPTSSADTQGAVGDITSDDSYVYVKTSTGWKRAALAAW